MEEKIPFARRTLKKRKKNKLYLITPPNLYFTHHFNHLYTFYAKVPKCCNSFKCLLKKAINFKECCEMILVYSTLLANYVNIISANPKVLYMAGSVLVLSTH